MPYESSGGADSSPARTVPIHSAAKPGNGHVEIQRTSAGKGNAVTPL